MTENFTYLNATPDRKASELRSGVNSRAGGVDFRIF